MEVHREPNIPQVALFVAVRVVVNAAYRMIYPFLPIFASAMGVSLQAATLPLTGRSLVGMSGPLLAPIAERYGRKTGMLFGLGLFCLGTGVVAAWPSFSMFAFGLVLANLGNQVFLPSMQAYLGDQIPYHRRGRILAITELSWSSSFILLVPLAGLLIARLGWVAPFWVFSAFGLLSFILVAWRVPFHRPHPAAVGMPLWHSLRTVLSSKAALAALSFSLSITAANEVVNVVFGAWMSDRFHLEIAALGLTATVIGLAELGGETVTVVLIDKIGKKRSVRIGIILYSLASLALLLLRGSLWGALLGLFLFYLSFEFTLVSFIPLMTEVFPQARATLMATNLAATSLGRAVGALTGPWLYLAGFGANALLALAINCLALLALSRIRVED